MKMIRSTIDAWYRNEYTFGAEVFRYAFGLYFLLVGVKKLRMGYPGFAEAISTADDILAGEIPSQILYIYGMLLPAAELLAGALLLINKHVKGAYFMIAAIYLSFIFGQMYNGNTSKIGTDYLPSLGALSLGVFFMMRAKKNA